MTPTIEERQTIAFDGNNQNAGIIQDFPDHSSEITQSALNRYNGLLELYGTMFVPNIAKNYQVTPMDNGNFNITAEGKEKWYRMKMFDEYQQRLKKQNNIGS